MGALHIFALKGVYSRAICRLWEGHISKERGYILGGRGRFWEGGIDSGSVTYSCKKGGIFWKEGIMRVSHIDVKTGGIYSGREV